MKCDDDDDSTNAPYSFIYHRRYAIL